MPKTSQIVPAKKSKKVKTSTQGSVIVPKEVVSELPKELRSRIISQSVTHQGPIPDPHTLVLYDKALPGAAERILAMAERQQSHDHSRQKLVVKSYHRDYRRGQVCAVIVTIVGLATGLATVFMGHSVEGAAIATASLTPALIGAFTGRNSKDDEKKK